MYLDYLEKTRKDKDPEAKLDPEKNIAGAVATITPFSVLFYTENIWVNFLYFIPLYLYFWLSMTIAAKKSWYPYPAEILAFSFGTAGTVLTILTYLIFFYKGGISIKERTAGQIAEHTYFTMPYYVAIWLAVIVLFTHLNDRRRDFNSGIPILLLIACGTVYPFFPLFLDHYWRGMGEGIVVLASLSFLVVNISGENSNWPFVFFLIYGYLGAVMTSTIIYAISF